MRNHSKFFLIFFSLYTLLLGACTKKIFHAKMVEETGFERYDTFAFIPNQDTSDLDLFDSEIIHYRSMVEVKNELNERGYRLDTANPDLLIAVHPMFTDISENPYNNLPYSYGGPGYMMYYRGLTIMPKIDEYTYQEIEYTRGTLMIDVLENGSHQLLYRGWSDQVLNAHPLPREIDNYVARLMQKFPYPD